MERSKKEETAVERHSAHLTKQLVRELRPKSPSTGPCSLIGMWLPVHLQGTKANTQLHNSGEAQTSL